MMDFKGWMKTAGVAAGGGGLTALITGFTERERLGIYFGSGRLAMMVLTGALTAVGALFLRSPLGQKIMSGVEQAKEQAEADKQALEAAKTGLKSPPSGPVK